MIGNFRIVQNASVPWLEAVVTKDGIVPLHTQAIQANGGQGSDCAGDNLTDDPNVLDLNAEGDACVQSVEFEMFKCGRTNSPVALQGTAEKGQTVVTEGEIEKISNKGLVRYKWHPQDTAVKGLYYGRFKLTFKNNTIMYWPYQLESLSIEVL